ncbi:uncharacterized protein with NRDE domain [Oikeobacillus pervagus]|uniref:Uncharacterized protein with NRDE domain n=1 Tax=Oikeobacillus pervagus TaxID=1325931 RepID=A0AAJ1WLM4_9BACI|nr:NRDE family protein [Oikeobacillus pervagus]MDQ0216361.1 uncharacterized protein with NRDE domain [Oikeobacillus pervagus]
MCLINLQFKQHPEYKLIIAANRDEFYRRPTKPVHFWEDHPDILAGRDLLQMGTWMGISKTGRFAALTNYRDPNEISEGKKSRGEIIRTFLLSKDHPKDFLFQLDKEKHHYPGFNVIAGTVDHLFYYGNRYGGIQEVQPGTHSLSNAFLNTPWPKVMRAKEHLANWAKETSAHIPTLFQILQDLTIAPDDTLPETGVSLDWERRLSPIFIQSEEYGTRSSTIVLVDHHNHVTWVEQTYEKGKPVDLKQFKFSIES